MFFGWIYALLFTGIIAINHKYGKPDEEYDERRARHKQRTQDRLRKYDEDDRKSHEEWLKKRKEAKRKKKEEDERLRERRESERSWVYGVAPRRY